MSNNDLWGEEEPFTDMPEEAQTGVSGGSVIPTPHQYAPPVLPKPDPRPEIAPQQIAEPYATAQPEEAPAEEENQEDLEVLADADLRLEQGSLYKLIMKHDFFAGMDVDQKAAQNVQKEIRQFAKERMEVMLGMRRESAVVERLEIDFPFNTLEVDILKQLAHAATKGATENSDKFVPGVSKITEELPSVPRKRSLNPIGHSSQAPRKQPAKPLQRQAAAPVKRTRLDATIDQIAREEGIPRELLEENSSGVGGKSIHEMTASELEARNKLAAQRRGTQVKSANAIPPVTPEQEAMLAISRAEQFNAAASGNPLMTRLLEQVKNMPIKNS